MAADQAGTGRLSDQIIDQGPFVAGDVVPFQILSAAQMNALRDELIELRTIQVWRLRAHYCSWNYDCEGAGCPACPPPAEDLQKLLDQLARATASCRPPGGGPDA